MRQVHAGVAEAVAGAGGREQHGGARLGVGGVAHGAHQVVRHQFDGALRPQIADRVGALVGGPQRRVRGRLARRVGQRRERLDGVAQHVEAGAGRHHRRQRARVVGVDDTEGGPQRAVCDAGLGAHLQVVEDRHAGSLATGAGGGGHRHQRLERSGHRLAASDRVVDVGEQLGRVGGVQVGRLGGVHGRAAADRGKAVAAAVAGGADRVQERGVAGLDARVGEQHCIDAGAAQRLARYRHRLRLRHHGVGDQERAPHAEGA